jgi:penicillin-binding protein 1C
MKFKRRIFLFALIPILVWFYFCLPNPLFNTPYSTVINDINGELLGATTALDEQWRFPVSDSIPLKFEKSILYFEDEHFYRHPGVNPVSLAKAFYQNWNAGKVVRGGSTLSMQVIRLSRNQSRTYLEKLYECILAVRLELGYSKKEILALYAAHAPFGGNVVGLEAASWRYFQRPPDKLSWGETTTLAVLPNAPSLIFPGKNHELLIAKRNRLLDKLVEEGVIDKSDAFLAKGEPIPGKPHRLPETSPHVLAKYKISKPAGSRILTTLDERLQKITNDIVQNYHRNFAQNQIHNAAALVVNTKTGEVKAYVGNTYDVKNNNENAVDIITSARSSGSTLKPFLYNMMQQKGQLLPNTLLPDVPTYISGYAPKNFDEKFDGAVPASNALARSLNVPAVRMLQQYGVEVFHHDLKNIGFPTVNRSAGNYGLSLILGGAEVTLWDLVNNYRKMALAVDLFHDPREEVYEIHLAKEERKSISPKTLPFSAGPSWITLEALKVMDRPIEGSDWRLYNSSKTIAWKTGTSFGHKDAWAIGVTPDYVIGVWIGNADGEGRPGLTGASAAAPVMFDIFKQMPSNSWFTIPENDLIQMKVCAISGYQASEICPVNTTWVALNGDRSALCTYHKNIHLDATEHYRVNGDCYRVSEMVTKTWFVLPPVMEWFYKSKNPYYKKLPEFQKWCVPNVNNIELIYPQANAKLFIPRGFNGEKEKLVFEATHRSNNVRIYWHLDNQFMSSTVGRHQIELQPNPGKHYLTLVSEDGEVFEREFEIVK